MDEKVDFFTEGGEIPEKVDSNNLPEKVKEELKKDNWVNIEKEDGSTEVLTKKDLPEEETETEKVEDDSDWRKSFNPAPVESKELPNKSSTTTQDYANKFKKIRSVTSMSKSKGG